MSNAGNVHDNSVTEAQTALLKALTPHIIAMSPQQRQCVLTGNMSLPALSGAWLRNSCCLEIKAPSVLAVNRSKPFNPTRLFGVDCSVIPEREDNRSHKLKEIDFSRARFENLLRQDEPHINGSNMLRRLKLRSEIRADANIGWALVTEREQRTLRWIHEHLDISWIEFPGTVLENPGHEEFFFALCRLDNGQWEWRQSWFGCVRDRKVFSLLFAA